jgi:UDP-N-acetylmuramate dehydrogenase
LGKCNNTLVTQNASNLAVLGGNFSYIDLKHKTLRVGAATTSGKLLSFARKNSLASFEFLSKLPGTIGGLVSMNAGLKGFEIFDNLVAVKTSRGYIERDAIEYGYRFSKIDDIVYEIIFDVEFGFSQDLLKELLTARSNQPNEPSLGSCFKNPKDNFAGKLIEDVGLKGYRVGGVAFSDRHANFLVNLDNGSIDDVLKIIDLAKTKVFKEFGVELSEEIVIL